MTESIIALNRIRYNMLLPRHQLSLSACFRFVERSDLSPDLFRAKRERFEGFETTHEIEGLISQFLDNSRRTMNVHFTVAERSYNFTSRNSGPGRRLSDSGSRMRTRPILSGSALSAMERISEKLRFLGLKSVVQQPPAT